MARILKDFAARKAYLALCGGGSGGSQRDHLGAPGHYEHSQCAHGIVELIGNLQHPFHGAQVYAAAGSAP